MKSFLAKLNLKMNASVSGSTLGLFRVLFGTLMFFDFRDFYFYFSKSLIHSNFLLQYDGFGWLQMLPEEMILPFFSLMMVASFLFVIGYQYRTNAIIVFLGFAYIFFLDKGHYNNHFYLYTMLLFFFTFVDARWGGIGAPKNLKIPYWMLFIFKLQICVVYFYGGLAKMDFDWLHGFPMRIWLWDISDDYSPGVQGFFRSEAASYLFSYGGILLDLSAGILLLTTRFKRWILPAIILFHFQNELYFNIGSFPMAMIAGTILFANPDFGIRVGEAIRGGAYKVIGAFIGNKPVRTTWRWFRTRSRSIDVSDQFENSSRKRMVVRVFLIIWFSFQMLFPLRQYAYQGNASWTGEGHLFAWRMMLVDTLTGLRISVVDPETHERIPMKLESFVTWRQFYKMSRTPKSFLRLANHIGDIAREEFGHEHPIVRMEIIKSVNERPPKLLNDTTLNYADVDYKFFARQQWINPWSVDESPLVFGKEQYARWRSFMKENYSKVQIGDVADERQ